MVNDLIRSAKSNYYSSIITENKGNQKVLFKTIDQLLNRKPEFRYPASSSKEQLANDFAAFFHERISKMRNTLSKESDAIVNPPPDSSCCHLNLSISIL